MYTKYIVQYCTVQYRRMYRRVNEDEHSTHVAIAEKQQEICVQLQQAAAAGECEPSLTNGDVCARAQEAAASPIGREQRPPGR